MKVISVLLALLTLLSGGTGGGRQLLFSDLNLTVNGQRQPLSFDAALSAESSGEAGKLDFSLSKGLLPLYHLQLALSDEALAVSTSDGTWRFPAQLLAYGDDLTGLDRALLDGVAMMPGVKAAPEDWVALLQQPLLDAPESWTVDAQGAGALLDRLAAGWGDDAPALYAWVGQARRRLADRGDLAEVDSFAPILEELGLRELSWQPEADGTAGTLRCVWMVSAEDWERFREAASRELRMQRRAELICAVSSDVDQAARYILTWLEHEGVDGASTRVEDGRMIVSVPVTCDLDALRERLEIAPRLEFRTPNGDVVVDNAQIESFGVQYANADMTQYGVGFQLNDEGAKAFEEATRQFLGQAISIYLDDELISAPTVQSVISGGSGIITGSRSDSSMESYEWASQLADNIGKGKVAARVEQTRFVDTGVPLLDGFTPPVDEATGLLRIDMDVAVAYEPGARIGAVLPLDALGLRSSDIALSVDRRGWDGSARLDLGRGCSARLWTGPLGCMIRVVAPGGAVDMKNDGETLQLRVELANLGEVSDGTLALCLRRDPDSAERATGEVRLSGNVNGADMQLTGGLEVLPAEPGAWRTTAPSQGDHLNAAERWQAMLRSLSQAGDLMWGTLSVSR